MGAETRFFLSLIDKSVQTGRERQKLRTIKCPLSLLCARKQPVRSPPSRAASAALGRHR